MKEDNLYALPAVVPRKTEPLIPSAVLGMLTFLATEVMFFAGLISAYTVSKSWAVGGLWPPPGQPRLPVEETALNTLALLASGVLTYLAHRAYAREPLEAKKPLLAAIVLGLLFVCFQGVEWVSLIGQGLTLTSSSHGSFFYLIVGIHALHAIVAIIALCGVYRLLITERLEAPTFWAVEVFWYFVVGLWPILYVLVYL